MAESVLQPYRKDIARLYFEERNSQAEIIRYLEQAHGCKVTPSTLSRFIKALPDLNLARISVNMYGVASCFNQPMALSIAGVPISRTGGPSL